VLNHSSFIDFQVLVTLGKNIRKVFHEFDVSLLDLRTERL
jgi:hypothetical protein